MSRGNPTARSASILAKSCAPHRPPRRLTGWGAAVVAWSLGYPALLLGQAPADSTTPPPSPRIIRAVQINRETIFDSTETGSWLARAANALHVRTNRAIVQRELLFREGEPYDSLRVFETTQNLRSMGIFRRVQVDTIPTDSGVIARVTTRDAWSTRGDLRLKSTGGQVDYQIAFIEDNFLGNATRVGLRYQRTPDRSLASIQLRQRRLIADRVNVEFWHEERSDGSRNVLIVGQPFYSVISRVGFEVRAENRSERIFRFREGLEVPTDTLYQRFWIGRAELAKAVMIRNGNYLRVGLSAQVRRDDYTNIEEGPFENSVTGAAGGFVEWRRTDVLTITKFLGLGRDEEAVDLSTTIRVGALAALKATGYEHDGIGTSVTLRQGLRAPGGFAFLDVAANGLHSTAGLDSGSVFVGTTLAVRPALNQMFIAHAQAGWVKAPRPGTEFDYGLSQGPRAFRAHAFTGDRAALVTAEYRYIPSRGIGNLANIGFAAFADYGGAWYAGSPSRLGASLGIGLRFGVSRAANLSPNRLDLAYRVKNDVNPGGWVLSVGKGLLFSTTPR